MIHEPLAPELRTAPFPIPAGRGRWRITLHDRSWGTETWQNTMIAELTDARSRRLETQLNSPSVFTFTINGTSSQAPAIVELATDVFAWRWDEQSGGDVCMFRGVVEHSVDQVTEQSYTINFTARDYLAMLDRRLVNDPQQFLQVEQDQIVNLLRQWAQESVSGYDGAGAGAGGAWSGWPLPGSQLRMSAHYVAPDGTARGASGRVRDYTAEGNKTVLEAIDALSGMIDGFDYDVSAAANPTINRLRIWYPYRGVNRTDMALMYGANVSSFHRTVSASEYANWVRVVGNRDTADANVPPIAANAWNVDRNNVSVNPVGLWMRGENASDVSMMSTLVDKARGLLDYYGIIVPSYSVQLRPGAYRYGSPNVGDTVPFVAQIGRLNVDAPIRVVGIAHSIGDDDDDDVNLTLGRSPFSLASLLTRSQRDIDALARR